MTQQDSDAAWKVLCSWLLVGLSKMTPLEVAQLVATGLAIVYTGLQIYLAVRDRIWRRRIRAGADSKGSGDASDHPD